MKLPLSVFIITKNEGDRVGRAIRSVQGLSDDIVVVDSGSTDDTMQVAEALGARVSFNPWKGYGPQKCHAETLCDHPWLLNLDADEAVTPELAAEIRALFGQSVPPLSCYAIDIRMVLPHEAVPRHFAASNRVKRLYDRRKAGFKDSPVHDSVVVREGKTGNLRAPIHHRSFRGLFHEVEKINRYSTMQAEDLFAKGKQPSALRLIFEPFGAFLKAYVLRRYVVYGVEGFTQSLIYAFARTIRLAKARELFLKEQHEKHFPED